jgi:hypothetical protein
MHAVKGLVGLTYTNAFIRFPAFSVYELALSAVSLICLAASLMPFRMPSFELFSVRVKFDAVSRISLIMF